MAAIFTDPAPGGAGQPDGGDAEASGARGTAAGRLTRARLVTAATELITQGGYGAATVAAIAARADVAAGTLYRHFPSKAALFVEVFRSVCGHEVEAVEQAVAQQQSAAGRLDAVVETFASRALRNPRLAWALLSEPIDPLVDAERLDYRHRYSDQMSEIVRAGIATGEFNDQDPELAAAALVGAIGEALVGPISPVGDRAAGTGANHPGASGEGDQAHHQDTVTELKAFCRRAAGVPSTE